MSDPRLERLKQIFFEKRAIKVLIGGVECVPENPEDFKMLLELHELPMKEQERIIKAVLKYKPKKENKVKEMV